MTSLKSNGTPLHTPCSFNFLTWRWLQHWSERSKIWKLIHNNWQIWNSNQDVFPFKPKYPQSLYSLCRKSQSMSTKRWRYKVNSRQKQQLLRSSKSSIIESKQKNISIRLRFARTFLSLDINVSGVSKHFIWMLRVYFKSSRKSLIETQNKQSPFSIYHSISSWNY